MRHGDRVLKHRPGPRWHGGPGALTPGETWARAQLTLLRSDRYSPRALARFLGASQRRAADVREARPDVARRAHGWMATGAIAWLALAAAGREPYRRRTAEGIAWWAGVALMLEWHLGMFETEDGRPRNLGPADALTLSRAWLVPVMADGLSPIIIAVSAGTDLLDGPIARATSPTRAGRDLESLVDAAALGAALLGARRRDEISRTATNLELSRLTAGVAYGVVAYFGRSDAPDPLVTRAARATTTARVAGLLVAARGRRRAGSTLLAAGSLVSLASVGRALVLARKRC